MTDEQQQQQHVKQEKEPELKRTEEAVKDLEPEKDDADAVKGGSFSWGASNPA